MLRDLLPWLILFLPLAAAAVIALFTRRDRELSAGLSIGAVALSFVFSCFLILLDGLHAPPREVAAQWLQVGSLDIDFGLRLDPLSLMMLLVVTGVGGLIHIYSRGYMRDDASYSRFFACLSLFTFSMLGIVLANNFLQMFIFWELVGVSSYLLIGFWFEKPSAADACKKAFLTNRIGDVGFILGILVVWGILGSLNFGLLQTTLTRDPAALGAWATAAGLLIFCGAMGKSAQFPLHVWLPDAMEGPTPVSALIHAATMVAAGVYMLCRVYFLLDLPGSAALHVISWIGGITALLAALIAVQQDDIKRILAYSTLSQLGYMVMAVGLRAPAAAMFHLTTHAFFKALLFLGAGSVILALHHEQDIWKMGGLRKKLPATYWTFLAGTLALCGAPPFSGFFSKDGILGAALESPHGSVALFLLGIVVAVLTPFYMFRLLFVAFLGAAKSDAPAHAHEPPAVVVWPLRILAVPTVFAGFWGISEIYDFGLRGGAGAESMPWYETLFEPLSSSPLAAGLGLLAIVVGFTAAFALYGKAERDPLPSKIGFLARAMRRRFYFDGLYAWLIACTQDALAALADGIDRWIIGGVGVRGTQGSVELLGRALRLAQTGNLQTYAFLFVLGVAFFLFFLTAH